MIKEGQRFTCVNADVGRKEYVVIDAENSSTKGALARLRNVETGGISHVTQYWLQEGELPGRAYWLEVA